MTIKFLEPMENMEAKASKNSGKSQDMSVHCTSNGVAS